MIDLCESVLEQDQLIKTNQVEVI